MSDVEHTMQHNEANSILDWIKLMFHEDMGAAHLEHIVKESPSLFNLEINQSTNSNKPLVEPIYDLHIKENLNLFKIDIVYIKHYIKPPPDIIRQYRGPPIAS